MLEVRSIRQQQNIQVVHGNCSAYQYNPDNKHSEHKYIQIAKPKNRWTELKDFDNINWERLIDIPESLQLIKDLLLRYHPVWTNFLNIKRRYNTIFQMTSFGANTVREGGAKNLRWRFGCHIRRLDLATYNARTLRTYEKIVELEEEIDKLRWHIIGLSEVRREGEDTVILESGNLLYHREGDHLSQGGVGFIVHKSFVNNVVKIGRVSTRVAYLILRITKRYSLKVIQVYAPTSAHPDEEVEEMYEDISRAMHSSKTQYTVLMGDFNAKLGTREKVGKFGIGQRNPKGQQLADFMKKKGLFMMNSFFQKRPHRKWTWSSPDDSTKNEIDFIMTTRRQMLSDVSVIARVKTGSDHRMVRGTLNLNIKLKRSRLMKSTLRPPRALFQSPETFQLELQNCFQCIEDCNEVDDMNDRLVETVHAVRAKFCKTRRRRTQKLSDQKQKQKQKLFYSI
ncbi:unnamed protein product [Parnassius mnemosyne]|uniref:Endonuclease/exonuclease/phosphatase domain-containing protein n=1 Tax=Parnassius mnemosyne TaxID=213953 RepID=A0AAV1LFI7_9NEOP